MKSFGVCVFCSITSLNTKLTRVSVDERRSVFNHSYSEYSATSSEADNLQLFIEYVMLTVVSALFCL